MASLRTSRCDRQQNRADELRAKPLRVAEKPRRAFQAQAAASSSKSCVARVFKHKSLQFAARPGGNFTQSLCEWQRSRAVRFHAQADASCSKSHVGGSSLTSRSNLAEKQSRESFTHSLCELQQSRAVEFTHKSLRVTAIPCSKGLRTSCGDLQQSRMVRVSHIDVP